MGSGQGAGSGVAPDSLLLSVLIGGYSQWAPPSLNARFIGNPRMIPRKALRSCLFPIAPAILLALLAVTGIRASSEPFIAQNPARAA